MILFISMLIILFIPGLILQAFFAVLIYAFWLILLVFSFIEKNDFFNAYKKIYFKIIEVFKNKERLLTSHRYGIHGMNYEHFGIGITEILNVGYLLFTPDSGGQVEIVKDGRLRYSSVKDAVEKISRVLKDRRLQSQIRTELERAKVQRNFKERIRGIIKNQLLKND